ncbi:MAG: MBL fold metallo-hydrolase [Chloroflexota bacterium]|nr:MAG: MBL fold metallo-hydrolase [Chloroflexota bacterium]
MNIRLIRNATLRLRYNGRELLFDPCLAPKHSIRSFAGVSRNPIVDLPCPIPEILDGVELLILSHLHVDHFDPLAQESLPENLKIFCQPGDEREISDKKFLDVTPIETSVSWQGITITRTPGKHGTGDVGERMGKVSGFVFQAEGEPAIFWAGDTIWYDDVQKVIVQYQPDVIITHSSGAKFGNSDPIVMDAEQTITVCRSAPQATVVAIHLESLDHGTVSRSDLRLIAEQSGTKRARLLIPDDGERIDF